MRRLATLSIAIAAAGCRLGFDELQREDNHLDEAPLQTPVFSLLLCAGSGPSCPSNVLQVGEETWVAGQLRFVATPVTDGIEITDLAIEPGPDGVHLEDVRFLSEDGPYSPDAFLDVTIDLPAGAPAQLIGDGRTMLTDFILSKVSLQFAELAPFTGEQ